MADISALGGASSTSRGSMLLTLMKLRTFIALIAVIVFFSVAAPNFLSTANLILMSKHVALNAFLADVYGAQEILKASEESNTAAAEAQIQAALDSGESLGFINASIVKNGLDEGVCDKGDPAKRGVDSDGDRLPDACDNCPSVANEAQHNRDGDHTGDACDPCPLTPQYGVQLDGDGDGVADSCDDCPGTANPPRACSSDADCGGGDNFCIVASGPGRCARQLDDVDGDAVGDACDSCVALANGESQGNANVHSEADRSVATLGDLCDPVPVVSTRQRFQHAGNADEATLEKMAGQILLSGNAAIGSAEGAPASFSGTVGFRFCACTVLDAKSKLKVLDAKTCLATRCRIDPAAFEDDPEGRWCKITTDGGFDERRAVSFDGSTHCSTGADLVTKPGPTERCVVGEPLSILWDVAADEKSSCVGDGGPPGIVWSHVLVGDAGFASERDRVANGAL